MEDFAEFFDSNPQERALQISMFKYQLIVSNEAISAVDFPSNGVDCKLRNQHACNRKDCFNN